MTTLNNVAKTAASNIGTLLVRIWDVSNKTLKHHNYHGLWRLTLLTSMIQVCIIQIIYVDTYSDGPKWTSLTERLSPCLCPQIAGLFPVNLLPKGKEEMVRRPSKKDLAL